MNQRAQGTKVEVYFGESDRSGGRPLYQALLEYLRAEGAAGATVTRGVAGFGHQSRIHTSAILRLSEDLPLVLTWIDAPERVRRLLPGLADLAGSGVITVEDVDIAGYGHRQVQHLRFDLPVHDVMTAAPYTVHGQTLLRDAVAELVERGFRAAPVTDASGRLVGMLTNADLVARGGLEARLELLSAMSAVDRDAGITRLGPGTAVLDVMTRDPVSISAADTLATAARTMSARRLKRLPVVDPGGRLVGLISRGDVLRAVGEAFPQPGPNPDLAPGATTVGEIMRREVPTVDADADLGVLLDAVASTRLNRAVIVDEARRVVGVVSDADVIRSLGESLPSGVVGAVMGKAGLSRPPSVKASDLITDSPPTLLPGTSLADAARLAIGNGGKLLPVVDEAGRLVGMLDRADLLHASRQVLDVSGEPQAPSGT
jgi:CBS domain-containing protein